MAAPGGAVFISGAGLSNLHSGADGGGAEILCQGQEKRKKISIYQALTSCLVGTVNLLCIIRI